jgi:ubiquinone/menaquinone biosynthesis C-methylase UbiE/mannose-6-phosphate isomerase-like protein (cupin superfamily)
MNTALNKLIHRHDFSDAEAYDRHAGKLFRGVYRKVADDVAAAAPASGVVLDAGCGSGRLAVEIAKRRPDLRLHGIDLESGMVDVATRHAKRENLADRVEFTVADLADLPLPDDSVDMVVSTASLHHWSNVGAVVASLNRVLRPQGRMWIYDMRWVSARSVRAASAGVGRRVDRALVRTGRFPTALFQRLALEPASRKREPREGAHESPVSPSRRPPAMKPCADRPCGQDGSCKAIGDVQRDGRVRDVSHNAGTCHPREGQPAPEARLFDAHWQPKIVGRFNDNDLRVVKVKGEFAWHKHEDTDGVFLVLGGHLTIQLRDRDVELDPGEFFVVPRGLEHCPRADEEAGVLLIEPIGTVNTGDAGGPLTAEPEEI